MGVYCKNCGMYFEDDRAICVNCGANLNEFDQQPKNRSVHVKSMTFEDAIASFWKRYSDFKGRSRRREFWFAAICNWLIAFGIFYIKFLLYGELAEVMEIMFSAMVVLPNLAVAVRRMHDTGKSGLMLLVAFIPLIGPIWLLILLVKDSDREENIYGESPKYYFTE